MARDSMRQAVELNKLPEHVHLSAAVTRGKTEHASAHEATRIAKERDQQKLAETRKPRQKAPSKTT